MLYQWILAYELNFEEWMIIMVIIILYFILKITFTQTNMDLERYWQSVYLKSIDQFEQK